MSFENRIVVVTGGGYGTGKQIALAFADKGAHVVVAARSRDKLERVAEEIRRRGPRALAVALDVSRPEEVEALFATVRSQLGTLDVLVNNSGIGGPTALARDVSLADWRQTIDVNLSGAFYCAKLAAADMIEARRGCIINIASIAGRIGFAHRTPYAASKWGMIGLSHSLAAELGPYGIRVNALCPGSIEGDRFDGVMENRARIEGKSRDDVLQATVANTPLGRLISEKEVADAAVFLASDAASGITGQALNVCGGLRMQ